MSKPVRFTPDAVVMKRINGIAEVAEIASEPMLFSASESFASYAGGPLTARILSELPDDLFVGWRKRGKHVVIDTRSHMLMPGQFPAIGGWHCDAFQRGANGQPDLARGDPDCEHVVVTLATRPDGLSRVEYASGDLLVESVDTDHVWASVHGAAQLHGLPGERRDHGDVVRFQQGTLHRATVARTQGWRFFFRASAYHSPPLNKVRRQVQVYAQPGVGW